MSHIITENVHYSQTTFLQLKAKEHQVRLVINIQDIIRL